MVKMVIIAAIGAFSPVLGCSSACSRCLCLAASSFCWADGGAGDMGTVPGVNMARTAVTIITATHIPAATNHPG